jgi:hypothetical protein
MGQTSGGPLAAAGLPTRPEERARKTRRLLVRLVGWHRLKPYQLGHAVCPTASRPRRPPVWGHPPALGGALTALERARAHGGEAATRRSPGGPRPSEEAVLDDHFGVCGGLT